MTPIRPGRGLGRGLASLIRDAAPPEPLALPEAPSRPAAEDGPMRLVRLDEIRPNPEQPREVFDQAAIDELAASIRQYGVMNPITLRQEPSGYVLIAGERRLRAAKEAGLTHIPATVRQAEDRGVQLAMALVENLQREDLDAIEAARGFQRLIEEYGFTQDQVASAVNKDRSTVANQIRLLKLPEFVLDALRDKRISSGHARALLGVAEAPDLPDLLAKVIDEQLNVRLTEKLVAERLRGPPAPPQLAANRPRTPGVALASGMVDVVRVLEDALHTSVSIRPGAHGGGQIIVEYSDKEDLDRLIDQLRSQVINERAAANYQQY
jgi:ParB family transcriptional regulator, chromosome partitioning protein